MAGRHSQDTPPRATRGTRVLKSLNLAKGFISKETILVLIVIGVLLTVGLTKGFSTAIAEGERNAPPTLEWGTAAKAGPYQITVTDIAVDPNCPYTVDAFPQCINATMTVTNTTDRFVEDPLFANHLLDNGLIMLTNQGDKVATMGKYPQVADATTMLPMGAIQPGFTNNVVLSWAVAHDVTPCDLQLEIKNAKWITSPMDLHEHWMKDAVIYQVPVCPAETQGGDSK